MICNPAQLPLPEPDRAHSPFYAGGGGHQMLEGLTHETPTWLAPSGRLLVVHNSLAEFPKSMRQMESAGLLPRVVAERSLKFRPLSNRAWLDELGGTVQGLYTVQEGKAYHTLYVMEASPSSEPHMQPA